MKLQEQSLGSTFVRGALPSVLAVCSVCSFLACNESSEPAAAEPDSGGASKPDAQAPMSDASTARDAAPDASSEPDGDSCDEDSHCVLVDDCCECSVRPVSVDSGECTVSCEQTQCERWGISADDVSCSPAGLGRKRCVIDSLAVPLCGPLNTVDARERCEEGPPECDEGTIAELDETLTCWSGRCVPVNLCNSVDGCAQCEADEVCLANVITGYSIALGEPDADGEYEEVDRVTFSCEPQSPECESESTCECESDFCGNGDCTPGPLSGWPYDTGIGNLDELSEGALICIQYDG